jgi:hypothetical protein
MLDFLIYMRLCLDNFVFLLLCALYCRAPCSISGAVVVMSIVEAMSVRCHGPWSEFASELYQLSDRRLSAK